LKLSARGVPTPADLGKVRARKERGYGNWCPSTIGGILRNDTYLGTWTYNTSDGEAFSVEIPQIIDRD
ncbi:MAG: hypothetical protein GTN49_11675, partial [candidate division Zixibacteria bacterium]|nr:hypothetical protein [candidate division Zixibacteria bacterium]